MIGIKWLVAHLSQLEDRPIVKSFELKEAIEYWPDMLFTMAEFVESFEIAIACNGKIKAEIKVGRLFGQSNGGNLRM